MFPVFPVLFPVCSQSLRNGFIVFCFPVFAARGISAVSCINFLRSGNTGNSGNWIEMEGLPLRASWNRCGTTGNKYPWR